ncbi:MAG: DUF2163 domain-containing protein [Proteobacteria bacterium]|nr:DUF2163 domain-containing protein [Pseudomonadota bacterium]
MRPLPTNLAAKLASGAATLCRCWRLTREDGVTLGFTDHDRDLTIAAQLFEATDGFEASTVEREAGMATQGGEVHGLLSSARIRAEDIEAGLYDGARLEVFLVDWEAPALDFRLDLATLGEIRRLDDRFIAETRDAFAAWDAPRGRLYTSACSARFGDEACGLDSALPAYTDTLTVTVVSAQRSLVGTMTQARAAGFFSLGHAQVLTGAGAGFGSAIEAHDGAGVVLALAPPVPLNAGDQLRLTAGCDKRFATCRDRFSNTVNFRGFPFIPAPEAIFTYAAPGEGRHKGRPLVR